jgi:hypothetical protein
MQVASLNNGGVRWQDLDEWEPQPGETYPCACGCGEMITYSGSGRPKKYVNATHRKRAYRRRNRETAATAEG